ncbi:MAG: hypothetical protein HOV81_10050 [Kofleriaceae bacterium]|nr:hypothetical protein [Kofleriaceae bacterium]
MKYGVFLAVLASTGIASAQPAPDAPQNQPPAPTRATFVSTGEDNWDVWVDKQPACQTPCSLGILPLQFVVLRSQERNPIRLDVGYMPAGDLMVTAKPLSSGMYATGIVFTTFSGMALATGITLTAVGCSTDRSGMCTAGLITGGVGAVGLYGSIYLMRKALPKVSVGAAQPYVAGTQVGLAGTF